MTEAPEIRLIAVDSITVLNPRARNKRIFQELVQCRVVTERILVRGKEQGGSDAFAS